MVQILFLNLNGSDKRSSNIYGAQKQNKNSADVYLVPKNKNMCLIFKYQIELQYSGISLGRTHHKADTLYKADKDFAPIL